MRPSMTSNSHSHQGLSNCCVYNCVWLLDKEFMGIVRSTFLIDHKSKNITIWTNVKVKDHAQVVMDTLKIIQN